MAKIFPNLIKSTKLKSVEFRKSGYTKKGQNSSQQDGFKFSEKDKNMRIIVTKMDTLSVLKGLSFSTVEKGEFFGKSCTLKDAQQHLTLRPLDGSNDTHQWQSNPLQMLSISLGEKIAPYQGSLCVGAKMKIISEFL